jgi:DNA polymerase-3 subunit gamma/tau
MALALYRSHRPHRFSELVGQQELAQTLCAEVQSGGLAHAYLFTGIRGTGKTSTARILAAAVNCPEQKDGEPCGVCPACEEIQAGRSVDVLEIDAASNRGIDEMRDLRERVKYLPATLRRKVYIVDEAHMLTPEACNAFLKTLEEPPDHVLFILCTTEAHKLPDTVRSRLQRFDFRRVAVPEITAHLQSVATAEGAEVEADALTLMARAAQGSMRDAISLLDQALSRPERPLSLATVRVALGFADPEMVIRLVRALGTADPAEALRATAQLFDGGCDPRQALHECARLARAAALCALDCPEGTDVDPSELPLCAALAELHPHDNFWIDTTEQMALAEQDLRQSIDPRLKVEITALRLVQEAHRLEVGPVADDLHTQVEELRRQVQALGTGARPAPSPTASGAAAAAPAPPVTSPTVPAVTAPPAAAPTTSAPAPYVTTSIPSNGAVQHATPFAREEWAALIGKVSARNMPLGGVLRSCIGGRGPDGQLVIATGPGYHLGQVSDPANQAVIVEALKELTGEVCTVRVTAKAQAQRPREMGGMGG